MQIELDGAGEVRFRGPQQRWIGDKPEILQRASFAGHEMIAITDDAGAFDLHYLGFQTGGFRTIEAAKTAAPEFARKVLSRMRDMIAD